MWTRPLRWLWLSLLVVFVALGRPELALRLVRAERHGKPAAAAPNILIIVGDDHAGGTLGIDGDPRQATPRLDQLAREGVRFDRTYCNSPLCTASRQSFITGRLPHATGVTQLITALPDNAVTLGDWLGDKGYATAAFGKMHFNGPNNHGFVERADTADWQRHLRSHPPEGGDHRRKWRPFADPASVWLNAACQNDGLPYASMQSTYLADRAGEYFRKHPSDPFACVVSFYDPHSPFRFPREWNGRYRPEQFPVPALTEFDKHEQPLVFAPLTPADVQGIQAAYYTSISYVDSVVGRVLDALDDTGLAENTIVVYIGDNGYMRGEHGRFEKHCFYEPAVRVPLIIRWPGHIRPNGRVTDMVELVDLLPTLLELCGQPAPPDLHGKSLVPLLKGEAGARGHDVVVSEYQENEEAMARSERYKLIVGTGHRKREDGYISSDPTPGPYVRLYDEQNDPAETKDLCAEPSLASIKQDLLERLHARLTTTRNANDPVPAGLSTLEAIHWCLIPRDKAPKKP